MIENVRKISSTVWVNKNQCERIADRFTLIAEGLKVMELDKDFPGGKALDGGGGSSSSKDYPGFDELLTVLRKGEALVSSYEKYGVWKAITSAVSRTDNREAFQEIHLELDTLNSQFQFEGSNGKYVELASGVDRSDLLTEDAEKDLKELPKNDSWANSGLWEPHHSWANSGECILLTDSILCLYTNRNGRRFLRASLLKFVRVFLQAVKKLCISCYEQATGRIFQFHCICIIPTLCLLLVTARLE